ncbi:MAG TPA: queuosine precursor transporter [Alphaproteobacteria bacterium]|nr:queuosine precursor transporter [Alphaproteobacteria bacterium]
MSSSDTSAPGAVSIWFLIVTCLFVTCLVVSNIVAVKLALIAGLVLPAAIIIFPLSYILGDVLTEVYGYARARQAIWLGFACNLLAVIAIAIAGALPAAAIWDGQDAFQRILGQTPRILAASFLAYLVGEFVNAYVLARLKLATNGRLLWLRTIGSTLIGQAFDSAIFMTAAFAGVLEPGVLAFAIVTQWLFKSIYEALATPATYAIVGFLKRREGRDVFDRGLRFNPLAISD